MTPASRSAARAPATPRTWRATKPTSMAPLTLTRLSSRNSTCLGRRGQRLGDVLEELAVGLHDAQLVRQEAVVEVVEDGPGAEVVVPVQRIGVAETADRHLGVHLVDERFRAREQAAGPVLERVEEFGGVVASPQSSTRPAANSSGVHSPRSKRADPTTRQPTFPQLVVGVDGGELLHRADAAEVDEHSAEIEQHDLDRAVRRAHSTSALMRSSVVRMPLRLVLPRLQPNSVQ